MGDPAPHLGAGLIGEYGTRTNWWVWDHAQDHHCRSSLHDGTGTVRWNGDGKMSTGCCGGTGKV